MILRLLKWGTLIAFVALIAAAAYSTYVYRQIRDMAGRDEAQRADAIVVLGAAQYNGRPSPVLKARLDHALELYRGGLAPAIITTGSYGQDPNFSEAEVGRKYLVQHGVQAEDIVSEQGSGTTTSAYDIVPGQTLELKETVGTDEADMVEGENPWMIVKRALHEGATDAEIDEAKDAWLALNHTTEEEAKHLPTGFHYKMPTELIEQINAHGNR